jgi:hypothetical protein
VARTTAGGNADLAAVAPSMVGNASYFTTSFTFTTAKLKSHEHDQHDW